MLGCLSANGRYRRPFRFAQVALLLLLPTAVAAQVVTQNVGPRTGFYDTTWPYGRSDGWRTGAVTGAGLPEGVTSDALVTQSLALPSTPYWGVTYSDGSIFVLGGQPDLLGPFALATANDVNLLSPTLLLTEALNANVTHPYIAKIDPQTMTVIGMLELPTFPQREQITASALRFFLQGETCTPGAPCSSPPPAPPETLNYFGNIFIHGNGNLYVVSRSTLYEINPDTLEITGSLALPTFTSVGIGTVYNGMTVAPLSGDIILKAFNFFSNDPAILVSVDASDLSIRFRTDLPGVGATRLTAAAEGDTQYLYITNDTVTQRLILGDTGVQLDDAWSQVYRTPGDGTTGAVSLTYMGDSNTVIFQNNNSVIQGVTAPLTLYTQRTDTTDPTITNRPANSSGRPGGSWSSLTADPFNTNIVVTNDSINGRLVGWRLEGGGLVKVWETDQIHATAGPAIASDREHLYIDDRRCSPQGFCQLFLLVVDLNTGDVLAEAKVAGSLPSFGQIFMDGDSVFMIAMEAGRPGRIHHQGVAALAVPLRRGPLDRGASHLASQSFRRAGHQFGNKQTRRIDRPRHRHGAIWLEAGKAERPVVRQIADQEDKPMPLVARRIQGSPHQSLAAALVLPARRDRKRSEQQRRAFADNDGRQPHRADQFPVHLADKGKAGVMRHAFAQAICGPRVAAGTESDVVESVDGGIIGRRFGPDRERRQGVHGYREVLTGSKTGRRSASLASRRRRMGRPLVAAASSSDHRHCLQIKRRAGYHALPGPSR